MGHFAPLRFHVTEPSGEFVGVAQGLLFEGSVLAYDPATHVMEWIPVWGTINDLSPMENTSAQELSNITLPDSPEDRPQMDQFGECCEGPMPEPTAAALCTSPALHEEETME